jgi:hypothetical protein
MVAIWEQYEDKICKEQPTDQTLLPTTELLRNCPWLPSFYVEGLME